MTIKMQSGQAIIQALVAAAICSIILTAIAGIATSSSKENRRLGEKLASLDLERVVSSALNDGTVCTSVLTGQTFNVADLGNATNPPSISIPSIPVTAATNAPILLTTNATTQAHTPASPLSADLFITSLAATDLVCLGTCDATVGTQTYKANLVVSFDNTPGRLISPLQPIKFPIEFQTGGGATQAVSNCIGSTAPASTGPSGPVTPGTTANPGGSGPGLPCGIWPVPPFNKLTVELWGGGGGGGQATPGTSGANSTFALPTDATNTAYNVVLFAGGGTLGGSGAIYGGNFGGAGGGAGGGDIDLNGGYGGYAAGGSAGGYPGSGGAGGGANSPGGYPGGGGGGCGYGHGIANGGGGGGYVRKVYTPDQFTATQVQICVGGGGGSGGNPWMTGACRGANGKVQITVE